jgi:hypothetical protein
MVQSYNEIYRKGREVMPNITEVNTLIEVDKPNGDIERHFPITKIENILGLKDVNSKYTEALSLLAANSYIIDDETGETYRIGSSGGKFYFTKSDVSVLDLLKTIVDATSALSDNS